MGEDWSWQWLGKGIPGDARGRTAVPRVGPCKAGQGTQHNGGPPFTQHMHMKWSCLVIVSQVCQQSFSGHDIVIQ